MDRPLTFAVLGCGARARAYMSIATRDPARHRITAAADPVADRRAAIAGLETAAGVREFATAEECLAAERLADVALITTQDQDHFGSCRKALERGYDVLLEKPAASSFEEVLELNRLAGKLDRKIVLCFVLRYTPFYQEVKRIVSSGRLGEILSAQMVEGVEPWHFTHSFVRGHWARAEESTPMIVAKCCHDTDVMSWLVGSPCRSVSSFGATSHFHPNRAPAGATMRCTDHCPHCGSCPYDAHRYAGDKREPWLDQVMTDATAAGREEVLDWVNESPWGRCVYHCDNNTPDHQIVTAQFESGTTASLVMTAFDEGRRIHINGSLATLNGSFFTAGSNQQLTIRDHHGGATEEIEIPRLECEGYASHGGGDPGLVSTLYPTFRESGDPALRASLLDESIEGHRIAFAAEKSRLRSSVVALDSLAEVPGDATPDAVSAAVR